MEIFTKYLYYLEEDSSSEVVISTLESLETLILKLGLPFLASNLENLVKDLIMIMKGKAKAQNEEDQEDIDDVREDIFEMMTDIIPALNKVLKEKFNPYFETLFKTMFSFLSIKKDINYVL